MNTPPKGIGFSEEYWRAELANRLKQMNKPLKIWQTQVNGQNVTISVWPDKKVRTGYFEKDFWTTLTREGLSLSDEEWTASPGDDWKDITPQD